MAAKKVMIRRRGPSPQVAKLKNALASARKGAVKLRAKVNESESGKAALVGAASSGAGATVAGVVDAFLGGGVMSKAARGGVGAVLVGVGGFGVKGKAGNVIACAGSGMLDTVAYEGGQWIGAMAFGGMDDATDEDAV